MLKELYNLSADKRKNILYNHGTSEEQQFGDEDAEPLLVSLKCAIMIQDHKCRFEFMFKVLVMEKFKADLCLHKKVL